MAFVRREITKNGLTGRWRFYPPGSITERELADFMQEVPDGLIGIIWEQNSVEFIQCVLTGCFQCLSGNSCVCNPLSDEEIDPPIPVAVMYNT